MVWLDSADQADFRQDWQDFIGWGDETRVRDRLAKAFPPDRDWLEDEVDALTEFNQRWQLLTQTLPQLQSFFRQRHFPETWIEPLWGVWLPISQQLQRWHQTQTLPTQPLIVGFLGGQGSGKTTLTALLKLLLEHQGQRVISLSLDDLYLPYADRLELQKQAPRLTRRGPPGTHDVALGLEVLAKFKQGAPVVEVPRFDKSLQAGAGDRSGFETYATVDFVLFEGWFVGARPVDPSAFDHPPKPIDKATDRAFARDMNQALAAYLPLWEKLDRLIVMDLQDYRFSKQWRKQAEHLMMAEGKPGMSDAAIDEFVEYFWKALHPDLFVKPLTQTADLVLEIDGHHLPDRVYRHSFS
jgi:D-glycerate 3-kinase